MCSPVPSSSLMQYLGKCLLMRLSRNSVISSSPAFSTGVIMLQTSMTTWYLSMLTRWSLRWLASMSVWSRMKKMKLKTFRTWMAKTLVSVGDKVIKLQEEGQLLARFLVIQQSRPELVPRLPATIGNYEMSVTPRSMFVSDGSLLIPTDNASIIHAVEEANPIRTQTPT